MTATQLVLDDLVRGFEHFGERYDALDVFARDVKDIGRALLEPASCEARPGQDDPAFVFARGGRTYKLRFHPSGIARLTRATNGVVCLAENPVARSLLDAALTATVLDHALPSAIVGFSWASSWAPDRMPPGECSP